MQEKNLQGDLADVFHLIHHFAIQQGKLLQLDSLTPVTDALRRYRFDAIYLDGYKSGKVGFISREFQQLMLEIWKVKYLEIARLREVILSSRGLNLDHLLDDVDSPGIPIPIYVGFLNRIREMAQRR